MKILFGARAFSGFFIYRETVFPSNASSGELRALSDKTSKILKNLIGCGVVILYAILLWLFPKMMTPIGMVASWGAAFDRSLVTVLSLLIWFASFAVLLVLHEALHMLAAVLVRWKVELLSFFPYAFRDRMKKTLPTACVRVHDTPSKRWKYILVYLLPFFVLTVLPAIAMLILQRVHCPHWRRFWEYPARICF